MTFMRLKQELARLLRRANLLGMADYILFLKAISSHWLENLIYLQKNPSFKAPPLIILFDALHSCSYREYFQSGKPDAELIMNTIRRYNPNDKLVIVEWGCGPGRVIQHLSKYDENLLKIVGTDYNIDTIKWCSEAFTGISFISNNLNPPLLIDEHSVDVVYAISVFTHLSEEMHYAWVREVLRILKPGGLFFVTLQGIKKIDKLLTDERNIFDSGDLVVREDVEEGKKNFSAFHSEKFVRSKLLSPFSKIDYIEAPEIHQDVWIAVAP